MKIFHHNDMDGRCAAALVGMFVSRYNDTREKLQESDFIECDYTEDIPTDCVEYGESVFIVDYSFTESTLHTLNELCNICGMDNVVWIDHHQSSLDLIHRHPELDSYINGIRSKEWSGAVLTYFYTYFYFNPATIIGLPQYVAYVSDYDTWKYEFGQDTRYFKLAMDAENQNPLNGIWRDLQSEYEANQHVLLDKLIHSGKVISQYVEQSDKEYRDQYAYESSILGFSVLVLNKRCNSAAFGNAIHEYDAVVSWVYTGSVYQYSIFSAPNGVNCKEIAEKFGGGGHDHAAGFISDRMIFEPNITSYL